MAGSRRLELLTAHDVALHHFVHLSWGRQQFLLRSRRARATWCLLQGVLSEIHRGVAHGPLRLNNGFPQVVPLVRLALSGGQAHALPLQRSITTTLVVGRALEVLAPYHLLLLVHHDVQAQTLCDAFPTSESGRNEVLQSSLARRDGGGSRVVVTHPLHAVRLHRPEAGRFGILSLPLYPWRRPSREVRLLLQRFKALEGAGVNVSLCDHPRQGVGVVRSQKVEVFQVQTLAGSCGRRRLDASRIKGRPHFPTSTALLGFLLRSLWRDWTQVSQAPGRWVVDGLVLKYHQSPLEVLLVSLRNLVAAVLEPLYHRLVPPELPHEVVRLLHPDVWHVRQKVTTRKDAHLRKHGPREAGES
mmetsp:Transcript_2967/g.8035  ORF Transcript_2967/g.8035 Transcript_2967/m.8035 type:complete len:358 (-) Transcript_2967:154-1227(-)